MRPFVILATLLATLPVIAAPIPPREELCARFEAIQLPAEDIPDPNDLGTLKTCDSEALYFGLGSPPNPHAARICAMARYRQDGASYEGAAVLILLYANGLGGERRMDVAISLACRYPGPHVEDLYTRQMSQWSGSNYSWCDSGPNDTSNDWCAIHTHRIEGITRNAALDNLARRWPPPAAAKAFTRLSAATEEFITTQVGNEVDYSGTLRHYDYRAADTWARETFLEELNAMADGSPPYHGAEKAGPTNSHLNAVYRAVMRVPAETFARKFGTIDQKGIKVTQAAWIEYRDAWIAFASQVDPHFRRDAVENWINQDRIEELSAFLVGSRPTQ
ncbi:hypothetical protein WV31_05100 [Magnetospirillum sp. ME-1]|uniref:lysozyme inhibitor LprI family protein n=1 Tax=Magnetospirillum sp. ME-1 TaxID=1639348 RepID=UPI000A179AFD|nr:lysozyme inhibitor LprI family protein [Magnetospirillum sp. ME-1]ARJ65083.1 hypothetical protein WV31_05100 [Magnetospirillum sp. ME-1]